ncbi:yrdC domain-containing protein, mitochondrial isoform X2 [Electrophorus electricus]|uniref:yrdC domain-containing protein, mitochondrial isoform X2 n=1 Tax=Electrophorus electricus TaxID=8005 RepID=UPI0015D07F0F|nr:yrdC domain-containing protein, mitochondrial isoform X2 [Electrophorus electricus]
MSLYGFVRTLFLSHVYPHNLARIEAMCKELKATVLRLLPQASNGPLSQIGDKQDRLQILKSTAKALKDGNVVAVPTDTIYGLACLAQNSAAIEKLYNIKGRNVNKPLAICVGEVQDIYKYCKVVVKEELLNDLFPGPVTLVLERSATLNSDLNPFTKEFEELWPSLAVVVDGGPIADQSRLGSTVVDLSVPDKYRIIRTGCACLATVDVLENKCGLSKDYFS